jgi:hypothetical protein
MIKYLFLLFSTISFATVNLFDLGDVEITHNIPDYLIAGKVYDVDIVVKKGAIGGFAKFQMEVPDGINVKAVETRNSSFTFKSNIVKNIWMSVPEESEVLLSYKFEIAQNFVGDGSITSRFVFIKDNERYSVEMESHKVIVGDGSDMVAGVGEEFNDQAFTPDKLKINRNIKALGLNEFEVSIIIEKDGLEGFAKIQDILPEGFEARPISTSKSVFSIVEDKVKFIWFNIPPEETIEASYNLISQYPVTEETTLNGSFNFLFNDEARQIDLPKEKLIDFIEDSQQVTQVDEEPTQTTSDGSETTTIVAVPVIIQKDEDSTSELNEEIQKNEIESKEEDQTEVIVEEVTYMSGAQSDIFYRVQLAAGRRNVSLTYLKKKHGFSDEVFLENHEGWFKYTTGNYPEYVSARDRREKIKQLYRFKGPFVTAYNAGERITVQEALLISKQKWVK